MSPDKRRSWLAAPAPLQYARADKNSQFLAQVTNPQVCNSWIVSILASCGRLPAIVPDLVSRPRQLVFLTPIDSQLNDFLNEIHQIAIFEPSIVERIDSGSGPARQKEKAAAPGRRTVPGRTDP